MGRSLRWTLSSETDYPCRRERSQPSPPFKVGRRPDRPRPLSDGGLDGRESKSGYWWLPGTRDPFRELWRSHRIIIVHAGPCRRNSNRRVKNHPYLTVSRRHPIDSWTTQRPTVLTTTLLHSFSTPHPNRTPTPVRLLLGSTWSMRLGIPWQKVWQLVRALFSLVTSTDVCRDLSILCLR